MKHRIYRAVVVVAIALGGSSMLSGVAHAAADTVDEIHYSYGDTPDSVVFDWHGSEAAFSYGPDTTYGTDLTASPPSVTPVDDPGPFQELKLTGLQPGTLYHYRIGPDGDDHTFRTAPTGDFTWVDTGDTGTTLCDSWMADTQALIAAQNPYFVTHGGDISYANECGKAAVHRYYTDQEAWSHDAAFMPVWGNHEYGGPNKDSLPGAIRDSLANYKGRSFIPNAQSVPNDTSSQTSNPGCPSSKPSTNGCQGEDWGWFYAGRVLFISYPEPWPGAYPDWEAKVEPLMAAAQANSDVDFIVTYGHRPAYSSQSASVNTALRTALTQLSNLYSPTPSNPGGKYVLNINHHIHAEEVFSPIGGLVNITNGGGGAGQANYGTPAANSLYRSPRPGILSAKYDATLRTLTVSLLCGPTYPPNPKPCIPFGSSTPVLYGGTLYTQTFTASHAPPPPTTLTGQLDDGLSSPLVGQQVTYIATATAPVPGTTVPAVTMAVTVPSDYSIQDADGGTVGAPTADGTPVTWDPVDVVAGTPDIHHVTALLSSGQPGEQLAATLQLTSSDATCTTTGSVCQTGDTDTIASPVHQWIANQTVGVDLTGWTGLYSARSQITRVTNDGYGDTYSLQVTNKGTARGAAGVNAKPRPVSATTALTPYTAGVWVRGQTSGQVLYLLLKEFRPDGTVAGSRSVSYKTADTNWNQLSVTYPAAGSGDQLSMSIYCSNLAPKAWFHADLMSLTSPN